ncbi:hypothetical protein GCK32_010258 [Trichostrongylus colubriformis]|uniref:Uncharacterized protein n=1 Tax=Trichostrongylus colubriformis TaxID=6319 RepID=A0AAN8FAD2_TRICO
MIHFPDRCPGQILGSRGPTEFGGSSCFQDFRTRAWIFMVASIMAFFCLRKTSKHQKLEKLVMVVMISNNPSIAEYSNLSNAQRLVLFSGTEPCNASRNPLFIAPSLLLNLTALLFQ